MHSSIRVDDERVIGLLKCCKWRQLKHLDMISIPDIPTFIAAECVQHNFVLQQDILYEQEIQVEEGLDSEMDTNTAFIDVKRDLTLPNSCE